MQQWILRPLYPEWQPEQFRILQLRDDEFVRVFFLCQPFEYSSLIE